MATYSASSWTFHTATRQGPIDVKRNGRKLKIILNRKPIIYVDLLTGRTRLNFWGMGTPSMQLCNAYKRFFERCGAKRYTVEMRNGRVYLIDAIRKSKQEIPEHGLTTRIPTKCVFNILQHLGSYWNFEEWTSEYIEEQEQARQLAAGTITINGDEVRADYAPF